MTDMTVTTGLRGCQNRQFYYGRHIQTYLRTTGDALTLMGGPIRLTCKKRKMSEADLAERIGIARSTLQSIEKGHAKVEIGLVFEAATLVGVPLFLPEPSRLTSQKPGVNMVAPERSSRSWRAGWGRQAACSSGCFYLEGANAVASREPIIGVLARQLAGGPSIHEYGAEITPGHHLDYFG